MSFNKWIGFVDRKYFPKKNRNIEKRIGAVFCKGPKGQKGVEFIYFCNVLYDCEFLSIFTGKTEDDFKDFIQDMVKLIIKEIRPMFKGIKFYV